MYLLPLELHESVLNFLSPADLASVARTSSAAYPAALRVLYRHISIGRIPPSVLLTLARRPDIARHVRCLQVVLSGTFFLSFYRRLATALSTMTALVSLDLFIEGGSWLLPDSTIYSQLQHFASSFPFDSGVANFLGNAPALETVHVDSAPVIPPALAQGSMARLVEFTGSSTAAAAIVRGRPVESIHITSGDLTEDMVPALAKSTASVTVLSITTHSAPVVLLQVLGRHLPHIMYLRVTSTCNLPAPPTPIFYEQVAGALAFFPNLQSFELSGMYWPSSKKPEDQQRIWHSQPLSNPQEEIFDLYSNTADFFFS
ncbi:hypothetical protein DFH07DRAFT_801047 [Mycena maculata]|uniref:F-box domain-containing protein n=1 Tax=Mycena maculata TaxID=230809 RepID=A0AAD7K0I4_9AGAR|nr:hypothetical protein DFH07DRAFT_801047 [Mycena maculata]